MSKKPHTNDEMPLFDIGGVIIPAVEFDKLRSGEWATIKRRTRYRPGAFIDAIGELDPDAWMAYIHICAVRSHTNLADGALENLDLIELAKVMSEPDDDEQAETTEAE